LPKLKVNSKNFSKSSQSPSTKAFERARALSVDALVYLANDPEHLGEFLAETGFDPADLRRTAQEPGFAGAMLDYLCSNEALLVAFARNQGLDPNVVEAARQYLVHHREQR
jgi:hypothetical protein